MKDPIKYLLKYSCTGLNLELASTIVTDPKFDQADKIHDWRNHVSLDFIQAWNFLSINERIIVLILAKSAADAEEWD